MPLDPYDFHEDIDPLARVNPNLFQVRRSEQPNELTEQEMLQYEQAYREFARCLELYDRLIESEICPERIDMLKQLRNYYCEDNK